MVVNMYIISPKKDWFKPVFFGLFDFSKMKRPRPRLQKTNKWSFSVLVLFGLSPVRLQSFASPRTGLSNTTCIQRVQPHSQAMTFQIRQLCILHTTYISTDYTQYLLFSRVYSCLHHINLGATTHVPAPPGQFDPSSFCTVATTKISVWIGGAIKPYKIVSLGLYLGA